MNQKWIGVIVTGIILVVFFGILIHAEIITDEKRFLITNLGSITQTILGEPFNYPDNSPDIDVHYVEILPRAESGWHTHSTPVIVTILHGEVDVYYCTGETANFLGECHNTFVNHYTAGDVFVEAINTKHNAINNELIPVKIHVVTLNPD